MSVQNHFSFFSLPETFDIDLAILEQAYFAAQRKFHPDRLTDKSPAARTQAIAQSMQANAAYEALKSPLKRAQHLLALQDIHVGSEKDSIKPSQALLVETMESREALGDADTLAAVEKLDAENAKQTEVNIAELSRAFKNADMPQAAERTIRLGYQIKFADEIRIKKKNLK